MGTNYYLIEATNGCQHCGRCDERRLHIGKSSAGWCFSVRIHPDEGINTLTDWQKRWCDVNARIENEYDEQISPADMLAKITQRSWDGNEWTADALRKNHAVTGPNGLARHAIGPYCAGHGEGTWDYIEGEFS